jgi:hypothetical protein
LYVRVRTTAQTVENQRLELTAAAERNGWQVDHRRTGQYGLGASQEPRKASRAAQERAIRALVAKGTGIIKAARQVVLDVGTVQRIKAASV